MAALTFFAYFFLGCGPSICFFLTFINPKAFLTLLTFFSCFFWLVILLLTSAIFYSSFPSTASVSSYAIILAISVFIQEICRLLVYFFHSKSVKLLEKQALAHNQRFNLIDKLYLAVAWGFGHSLCHSIFFFVSFLSLTTSNGTFYLDKCPQMSLFLVGSLYSISYGLILTSIAVISIQGFHTSNWFHIAYAPLVHMAASLITLLNLRQDGCIISMPVDLGIGVVSTIYATLLAWTTVSSRTSLTLPNHQDGSQQPPERTTTARQPPAFSEQEDSVQNQSHPIETSSRRRRAQGEAA